MVSPKEAPLGLVPADRQAEPSAESSALDASETQDSPDQAQDASVTAEKLQSAQELARGISSILQKIQPWKVSMPVDLRRELDMVGNAAESINTTRSRPKEKVLPQFNFDPGFWRTDVPQLDMNLWKTYFHAPHETRRVPLPPIVAFYEALTTSVPLPSSSGEVSTTDVNPEKAAIATDGSLRNLQRIYIRSPYIVQELEALSPSGLSTPLVIAPPYKILLEFLPEIRNRVLDVLVQNAAEDIAQDGTAAHTVAETLDMHGESSKVDAHAGPETTRRRELEMQVKLAHLRLLVEFIETHLADVLEIRSKIADGTLQNVAFDDLWHMFKPGELVVVKDYSRRALSRERLSKVYFVTGGQIRRRMPTDIEHSHWDRRRLEYTAVGSWTPLRVYTFTMERGGMVIGPCGAETEIRHFAGKTAITDLPVYPLRFHPDGELLSSAERCGRKSVHVSAVGHMSYEGLAEPIRAPEPRYPEAAGNSAPPLRTTPRGHPEDVCGEVYVDFEEFFQDFPDHWPRYTPLSPAYQDPTETTETLTFWEASRNASARQLVNHSGHEVDSKLAEVFHSHNFRKHYDAFKPAREPGRMTPEVFQLLGHLVPGYVFQHKRWYVLDVDLVHDIDAKRYSGFDDLVIPGHYKDLLLALVDNHASGIQRRKSKRDSNTSEHEGAKIDLVSSKGQGLIVLLHGPPGSGKTSTAETIAAYTQRPLYSLTCGDIGSGSDHGETLLSQHASRAEKWGCVLLLDEADVFLMQRNWTEVSRNALVSVFLRQLEYYTGILFLTTNRPGTMDEAFKSRIHISLRYPSIDLASTKQMWSNIMRRLERDNEHAEIKVEFDRNQLLQFAEKHYKRRKPTGTTWNGRQIRNAFQTALALGHAARKTKLQNAGLTAEEAATGPQAKKWMRVKLTVDNFRTITKTTNEFEDYIVGLRGKDSDLAREEEVRDDTYDPDTPTPQAAKKYAPSLFVTKAALLDSASGTKRLPKTRGRGEKKDKGKAKAVDTDSDENDAVSDDSSKDGGDDSDD